MRTQSWVIDRSVKFARCVRTLSRATSFCEAATESSRSRMSTSDFTPTLFASLRSLSPGTNSSERSLIARDSPYPSVRQQTEYRDRRTPAVRYASEIVAQANRRILELTALGTAEQLQIVLVGHAQAG